MKKKILIVYDNFGSGHRVIANIMEEMISKAKPDVKIKKITGASFANSPTFNFLVKSQNSLLKSNWVRLANFVVQKSTRYFSLPFLDISLDKKIYHFLENERPDIIIATVGGFSKALGFYAERNNIPFFIFVTNILPSNIDDLYPTANHLVFFEESKLVGQSFDPNLTYFKQPIDPNDGWRQHLSYVLNYFKDIYFKRIPIYHSMSNSKNKENEGPNILFKAKTLFGDEPKITVTQKDFTDGLYDIVHIFFDPMNPIIFETVMTYFLQYKLLTKTETLYLDKVVENYNREFKETVDLSDYKSSFIKYRQIIKELTKNCNENI